MKPLLQKVDPLSGDAMNEPVFLGNAVDPASGHDELQRLRLAGADEIICQHRFNQFERAERPDGHSLTSKPARAVLLSRELEFICNLS